MQDRVVASARTRTRPHQILQIAVAAAAETRGRLRAGLAAHLPGAGMCDVAMADGHRTTRVGVTVPADATGRASVPTGTTADVEWGSTRATHQEVRS